MADTVLHVPWVLRVLYKVRRTSFDYLAGCRAR